ncbi:MAG: nicotinamide-nucleotide amidohydrolase family protein [Bacilli bacterium]|nr:nicotinamide-nucleotide amidohydrolase family protein [Bacilli bacterium]
MQRIIEILTNKNKTISTMESCTGGALASSITDIDGASEILKFSAVTYSNEYKIKMGVNPSIIDKYSVYSKETATEMAHNIAIFANSNYGIGITGKLNRVDKNNPFGDDNKVFICIYDKNNNQDYLLEVLATEKSRNANKQLVINEIIKKLLEII